MLSAVARAGPPEPLAAALEPDRQLSTRPGSMECLDWWQKPHGHQSGTCKWAGRPTMPACAAAEWQAAPLTALLSQRSFLLEIPHRTQRGCQAVGLLGCCRLVVVKDMTESLCVISLDLLQQTCNTGSNQQPNTISGTHFECWKVSQPPLPSIQLASVGSACSLGHSLRLSLVCQQNGLVQWTT